MKKLVNLCLRDRTCGGKTDLFSTPRKSTEAQFRFVIFRRICNMQEKLFIQKGRFSFLSDQDCQLFLFKNK